MLLKIKRKNTNSLTEEIKTIDFAEESLKATKWQKPQLKRIVNVFKDWKKKKKLDIADASKTSEQWITRDCDRSTHNFFSICLQWKYLLFVTFHFLGPKWSEVKTNDNMIR